MAPGAVERDPAPVERGRSGRSGADPFPRERARGILSAVKRRTVGAAASLVAIAAAVTGWRVVDAGAAAPKDYLATLDVAGAPAGVLVPGGRAAVVVRITNSGPQDVVVHEIVGAGPITSNKPACNASSVTFTGRTDLAVVVPRKSAKAPGTADVTLPAAAAMSAAATNACQDATFTIPLSLAGDPTP